MRGDRAEREGIMRAMGYGVGLWLLAISAACSDGDGMAAQADGDTGSDERSDGAGGTGDSGSAMGDPRRGADGGLDGESVPAATDGTTGGGPAGSAEAEPVEIFEEASQALEPYARVGLAGGSDGLGGAAWLDYDADGDLDLFLTNGRGGDNALFDNDGAGGFTNVAREAGVANGLGNSGVLAADLDNDGYPELLVAEDGFVVGTEGAPTRLYHNQGDGTFRDVTDDAGLPGIIGMLSAAFVDLDGDGYLDLFCAAAGHASIATPPTQALSNRLLLNDGDLSFTDISEQAGIESMLGAQAATFIDYDDDGDPDLFVANAGAVDESDMGIPTPFELFRNEGDLTFTEVSAEAGIRELGFWMAVAPGDIDNDGDFDLFSTNIGGLIGGPHGLFVNEGDGTFSRRSVSGVTNSEFGWGASFADFDNDGDLDLIQTGCFPQLGVQGPTLCNPTRLHLGDGAAGFAESELPIDTTYRFTSGLAQADYDGDGFPDVAIVITHLTDDSPGNPVLLRNRGNDNRWLSVQLQGTVSNRGGVGAVIAVVTGDGSRQLRQVTAGSSFASSETPWPVFGLGKGEARAVEVRWPAGGRERYEVTEANRRVTLVEGEGEPLDQ